MNLCPACGIAASHNRQGGPCLACYRAGCARMVDAKPYRGLLRTLQSSGWTLTAIAEAVGYSRPALTNIRAGRTVRVRADLAEALDALRELLADDTCHRCDDVDTALIASADPQVIADRLGTTPGALARHLYRCGRRDVARLFAKPDRARAYERSRA